MTTPEFTGPDKPARRIRVGAVAGLAAATALTTLAALGGQATAASGARHADAEDRVVAPPNVTFPVASTGNPVDLKTFQRGKHKATDIAAPCGTPVLAAHPGTVRVTPNVASAGGTLVRVYTTKYHLTTWYSYLRDVAVSDQQIVQAGQPIGEVGDRGNASGCELGFQVRTHKGHTVRNPSAWLDRYVGQKVPAEVLFGNRGFVLATLNMLGASHTDKQGDDTKYPGYATRMPRAIANLNRYGVDVAGLQEFQKRQHNLFVQQAGGTYGVYPDTTRMDTENTVIWRKSSFDLVEAHTFDVTYFNGSTRHMPYVLLRQKSTGLTAYFMSVHNPANTWKYHHQEQYRARAIAAEKALIISLRATGRAVFLTGDLNDRAAAYCPLAEGKLMLAANTVPSMTCAPPPAPWIDWVLAAGPARFTTYTRDWTTRDQRASDHPIVVSQTYLAG